jgi:hypothetical protein
LNDALSVVISEKFDIFFSHAHVDKIVLEHVVEWLTKLGYRVWYDKNDMGSNIPSSISKGIANCSVVLTCANSTYQSRPNCMFELREANKMKANDKIIALILDDIVERNDTGRPHKRWMPSDVRIERDLIDILKFDTKMYCDISSVAKDPKWQAAPLILKQELQKQLQPLVKILQDLGCVPSFKRDIC